NKIFITSLLCFLICIKVTAQRDTTRRQTIEITSSYKPVLRDPVKINLYASPIAGDTTRPRLAYNIPAQNLFFIYQPVSLKPLALTTDTSLQLGDRNQLKLGFGSFTTPYVSGAFSFGDGKKSLLNVYGDYISSRGNIKNQDFSEINVKGAGSLFTDKNETYAFAAFAQHEYYQYGYDHTLLDFDKAALRRSFQDLSAGVGFRNITVNNLNITYNPHLELHEFSRESKASETTLILTLPAEKKFSESVSFKILATGNFNKFQLKNSSNHLTNNLFQLAPELVYYSEQFTFHGGATPSWNNNAVTILPNVYGEAQLQHNVLTLQAGWIGRYIANSFRTLSAENPYMQDPTFLNNTKEMQFYGGVKATLDKHFNFNAKAAVITYHDLPLFINDPNDEKSFIVKNESKLDDFQIHGDLNYINQDKFTITAGLDLNTYTGLQDNEKAWHLYPLKLNGSLRWNAFKQVLLKGDLVAFSGAKALLSDGSQKNLKGGTDLSAGAEFKVTPKFSAWLDFNNILNSTYQRWNNYPVYGLQVIGGILIHF
ncbi:MAG: hypothetical protein M3Z92_03730, partial [Bacteroidota bacterium]|nr:hypothetical protein [Bacteroidota bacterium]